MTKWQMNNEIMAERPTDLLTAALWDDPVISKRIRDVLDAIPVEDVKHYYAHFVQQHVEE